jgi:hypothetical protein
MRLVAGSGNDIIGEQCKQQWQKTYDRGIFSKLLQGNSQQTLFYKDLLQ